MINKIILLFNKIFQSKSYYEFVNAIAFELSNVNIDYHYKFINDKTFTPKFIKDLNRKLINCDCKSKKTLTKVEFNKTIHSFFSSITHRKDIIPTIYKCMNRTQSENLLYILIWDIKDDDKYKIEYKKYNGIV